MPASGWVRPHHSWPTPNARLMLARPRPVVELMTEQDEGVGPRASGAREERADTPVTGADGRLYAHGSTNSFIFETP